jgi:hypothetical protein
MRLTFLLPLLVVGCVDELGHETAGTAVALDCADTALDAPVEPEAVVSAGLPVPGRFERDHDQDGFTPSQGDCDDGDPERHPRAHETCDGVDNDCDGFPDDGLGSMLLMETDYGADDEIDRTTTYHYAASGKVVAIAFDNEADGITDSVWHYAYRAGELSDIHEDTDGDGLPDTTRHYAYNDDGNVVRIGWDTGLDGVLDRIDSYFWRGSVRLGYRIDDDADGNADSVYQYSHDAGGLTTGLVLTRFDDAGEVSSIYHYAYRYDDVTGRTSRVAIDLDGDREPNTISVYRYDTSGRLAEVYSDTDGDRVPNNLTTYLYGLSGDLEIIEIDTGMDGVDTRTLRSTQCWQPD